MKLYLSLGANLGNRGETLREALRRISSLPATCLLQVAPFYETEPWGRLDQPGFINTAAVVETDLAAEEFLQQSQQIEQQLGRVRHEHWGARTVDIDLLAGENDGVMVVCDSELLRLPLPYLTERAFVLVPLRDIAPELVIQARTVSEWCQQTVVRQQSVVAAAEISEPYPFQLIACVDEAFGLGRGGELLVRLPEDMAHFRRQTINQAVIMGHRTMMGLPGQRPLPERTNIVLSRSTTIPSGFSSCCSLEKLWQLLGKLRQARPDIELWCIGGAEVYRLLLPFTRRAVLTMVQGTYDADVFLPGLDEFQLTGVTAGQACEFCTYDRLVAN